MAPAARRRPSCATGRSPKTSSTPWSPARACDREHEGATDLADVLTVAGALAQLGPGSAGRRHVVPRHARRAPHETRRRRPAAPRWRNPTRRSPRCARRSAHEHHGSHHGRIARAAEHGGVRVRESRWRASCRRAGGAAVGARRRAAAAEDAVRRIRHQRHRGARDRLRAHARRQAHDHGEFGGAQRLRRARSPTCAPRWRAWDSTSCVRRR